jgi:hypothetical protein
MKGLIVAGVAAIAGIAGVVGLSSAAAGGGGGADPAAPVPAMTQTSMAGAQPTLGERLAAVRRAERAADRAMARVAAAGMTTSGRAVTASRSSDDDGTFDQGPGDRDPVTGAFVDDDDHGGGDDDDHRGRDHDDDDGGHGHERGHGGDDD